MKTSWLLCIYSLAIVTILPISAQKSNKKGEINVENAQSHECDSTKSDKEKSKNSPKCNNCNTICCDGRRPLNGTCDPTECCKTEYLENGRCIPFPKLPPTINDLVCDNCNFTTFNTPIIEYNYCPQKNIVVNRTSTISYPDHSLWPGWLVEEGEYPFIGLTNAQTCVAILLRSDIFTIPSYCVGTNNVVTVSFGSTSLSNGELVVVPVSNCVLELNIYICKMDEPLVLTQKIQPIRVNNRPSLPNNATLFVGKGPLQICTPGSPSVQQNRIYAMYMKTSACVFTDTRFVCAFNDGRNPPCQGHYGAALIFYDPILKLNTLSGIYTGYLNTECSSPNYETTPKEFVAVSSLLDIIYNL